MAIPIKGFKINHVMPPKLGQSIPSSVSADIEFALPARHSQSMNLREEWDELREHDIVFLVSITAPESQLHGGRGEGPEGWDLLREVRCHVHPRVRAELLDGRGGRRLERSEPGEAPEI